jgi:hypothetical protein
VIWFEIGLLSVPGFICACAQVAAERAGETPRVLFLGVLYHLGGFLGAYYARRLFPESKALAELTEKPPAAPAFFAVLAALVALTMAALVLIGPTASPAWERATSNSLSLAGQDGRGT